MGRLLKSRIILFLFILVSISAFYAGLTFKSVIVKDFEKISTNSASGNAKLSENSSETVSTPSASINPAPLVNSTTKVSPAPVQTTNPNSNSNSYYEIKSDAERMTLSGLYRIPDFEKINYSFSAPKAGGKITGSTWGLCTGSIDGNLSPIDSEGEQRMQAIFTGVCKPIVVFSNKQTMKFSIDGQINQSKGEIEVIYQFTEPSELRGYYKFTYNPQ